MLRSLRWGGTDTNVYGALGGKYVHTSRGGGGSQDFQMPEEDPLVLWDGADEFTRHALDVDLHPSISVLRGSGNRDVVEHTILLRHHRYPNMYVQPLACSPTSGALTCQDASSPMKTPPVGTSLVFSQGVRGADSDASRDKFDELGFQLLLNPYEEYSGTGQGWPDAANPFAPKASMGTNFSTDGMSFVLRMKSYLLAVAPEVCGVHARLARTRARARAHIHARGLHTCVPAHTRAACTHVRARMRMRCCARSADPYMRMCVYMWLTRARTCCDTHLSRLCLRCLWCAPCIRPPCGRPPLRRTGARARSPTA